MGANVEILTFLSVPVPAAVNFKVPPSTVIATFFLSSPFAKSIEFALLVVSPVELILFTPDNPLSLTVIVLFLFVVKSIPSFVNSIFDLSFAFSILAVLSPNVSVALLSPFLILSIPVNVELNP